MTWREPLDDLSAHNREVYGYYGVAMHAAQCVEYSLVLLFVYTKALSRTRKMKPVNIDRLFERAFQQTLGNLIEAVRSVVHVEDDLERQLAEALRLRNWLAHAYFRENAVEFMTPQGRDTMLAELKGVQEQLGVCDKAIMGLVRQLSVLRGIDDEYVEREMQELVKHGDDGPGSRLWREQREQSRGRASR